MRRPGERERPGDARTGAARRCVELLAGQRWASLATLDGHGRPHGSMVAYALDPVHGALLLHVSHLAAHTPNLLARPEVALTVSEPDRGGASDPQTLARVSMSMTAAVVAASATGYAGARAAYLDRLPEAGPRFEFGDFVLVRLSPIEARYIGGFADAHWIEGVRLADAIRSRRG